jgi:hypothetical protein
MDQIYNSVEKFAPHLALVLQQVQHLPPAGVLTQCPHWAHADTLPALNALGELQVRLCRKGKHCRKGKNIEIK